MMHPVLVAAGVLLFGICAFDMMGILVRMLGGSYPILQISALRNLFGLLPALFLLWRAQRIASLQMLLNRRALFITLIRSLSDYRTVLLLHRADADRICHGNSACLLRANVPDGPVHSGAGASCRDLALVGNSDRIRRGCDHPESL